jgi:Tfp pilus assembly protein PilW
VRTRPPRDEVGLSLIELIVTVVITGFLLTAVAAIFLNSWKTQDQVTTVTGATDRGQLIGASIERAVRNGLYVSVNGTGDELRVRTSFDGSALKCQGFKISTTGIQVASSATTLGTTWATWNPLTKAAGSGPYFTLTNGVLTYSFNVATSASPVRISGEVAVRSDQESGNGGCW